MSELTAYRNILAEKVGKRKTFCALRGRHPTESVIFFLLSYVNFLIQLIWLFLLAFRIFEQNNISCPYKPGMDYDIENAYCFMDKASNFCNYANFSKQLLKTFQNLDVYEKDMKYKLKNQTHTFGLFFLLILQSLTSYIPHYIWMRFENKKFENVLKLCPQNSTNDMRNVNRESVDFRRAVECLKQTWGSKRCYALQHLVCETLAWINIILQIYFLSLLFKADYFYRGFVEAIQSFQNNNIPAYQKLWNGLLPTWAYCHFKVNGTSGDSTVEILACHFGLNNLDRTFYLLISVWHFVVVFLGFWDLIIFFMTCLFSSFRAYRFAFRIIFLIANFDNAEIKEMIYTVVKMGNADDWFMLFNLYGTMSTYQFERLVTVLHEELSVVNIEMREPQPIRARFPPIYEEDELEDGRSI